MQPWGGKLGGSQGKGGLVGAEQGKRDKEISGMEGMGDGSGMQPCGENWDYPKGKLGWEGLEGQNEE